MPIRSHSYFFNQHDQIRIKSSAHHISWFYEKALTLKDMYNFIAITRVQTLYHKV